MAGLSGAWVGCLTSGLGVKKVHASFCVTALPVML